MIETALVFDEQGDTLRWHEPLGRSGGSLPDSRDLWLYLLENRGVIGGIAHTHPWDGPAWPSTTDVTTFRALEQGLGKLFLWTVVTFTDVKHFAWNAVTEEYCELDPKYVFQGKPLVDLEELRTRSR